MIVRGEDPGYIYILPRLRSRKTRGTSPSQQLPRAWGAIGSKICVAQLRRETEPIFI
jgi:hypothetical protein